MPIRINLLAEAQAAEEMRRKDPVKRSIWIGSFVIFLVLLWSATLQFKIIVAKSEASSLQSSWKEIEGKVKEVTDHRARARVLETKLAALDQFTTNRMLWAVTLDALQRTPLEGVELVRIQTEQNFTQQEGTRPAADGTGTAKPATATERTTLTLEARDYSSSAGSQVSRFKQSLASSPYFEAALQKTNTIQLTSQTAPQYEAGRSFVGFGFKMYFEEKERRLYE
jgi:hypothetical protein